MRKTHVTTAQVKRRDDPGNQQHLGTDVLEQEGEEEEGRQHGADFGKRRCEARPVAADMGREDLTCQQIGLRVRPHIRHEVEQHEAGEKKHQLCGPHHALRHGRETQANGEADEADNL